MKRKMCGRPLLSCLLAVLLCIGAAPAQAAETPASEKSGAVNWVETVDEGILQEPVEIPILMYHNLVAEEDDPSISKNTMWVGQFHHHHRGPAGGVWQPGKGLAGKASAHHL